MKNQNFPSIDFTQVLFFVVIFLLLSFSLFSQSAPKFNIESIRQFNVGEPIGKLRAVPVSLAKGEKMGILLVYSQDKEIDPYNEMFFFPKHPLKLVMYDGNGNLLWRRVMDIALVPGIWFCPVMPFDLDKDGRDEIWLNNTTDTEHPLGMKGYRLQKLNALSGEMEGDWAWNYPDKDQSNSHFFRNFIFGGYVHGEPVLITAQGTYGPMYLQAWNSDMSQRWKLYLPKDNTARGSHMCSVVDIDNDESDEFMWGERCINMDKGVCRFIGDSGLWNGHSDVIQPVLNKKDKRWYIFTCRESYYNDTLPPRVVAYNDKGQRLWYDVDFGHMDMGWTANLGKNGESFAYALKIGKKVAGEKGFFRSGTEEYVYDTFTGEKRSLPFSLLGSIPVDFNGDGIHELVCAYGEQGDRNIYTAKGDVLLNLGKDGIIAMGSKFCNWDGEQILVYYPDGTVKIFADKNAKDTPKAKERYESQFYKRNQKLTATGYNIANLGGL